VASTARSPGQAEIWIREVRSRRQAFYRCPALKGLESWKKMFLTTADKAVRAGTLDLGNGLVLPVVVSRETNRETHPLQAQFADQARALNQQIDELTSSRGAA
jgi:hypothetical protein